jgi:ABC-type sugar transport system ATPase subunit
VGGLTPSSSHRPPQPVLGLRGISKRFGGIQAVRSVDLDIAPGEIHALVGENGAGKSTLGRIVAGAIRPDAGTLVFDGTEREFRGPADALRAGIAMVQQETALVPSMGVAENVFLGVERPRFGILPRDLDQRLRAAERETGIEVPRAREIRKLSVAQRKQVEILRAVVRGARLIVMDEPTAALAVTEAEHLHDAVRLLAQGGTATIYVSHHLDEVLALAARITVMRNGEVVRTGPSHAETPSSLASAMLGGGGLLEGRIRLPQHLEAPVRLAIRGFSDPPRFDAVDLEVRAGEIVGLAGLVGSGRTEIARAIFGAEPPQSGALEVDGVRRRFGSPRDAIGAGIAMIPENRKEEGLVLLRSVRENISLAHLDELSVLGVVRLSAEDRTARRMVGALDIRPTDPDVQVARLSGGNQQKALFAKWLVRGPRALIADEPTSGIDVGAKEGVHRLITSLADDGVAVLLISSEFEELERLCDRVHVVRAGRIVAELAGADLTTDTMSRLALGVEGAA